MPAPEPSLSVGSVTGWSRPKLAFFCSAKCPGEILLRVLKTPRKKLCKLQTFRHT